MASSTAGSTTTAARGRRVDALRARSAPLAGAALPLLDRSSPSARRWYLLGALLASIAAYLRLPPGAAGSIWAEDGTRFLTDQLVIGWPASTTEPYAGYMHLVPRLAALVAGEVPPRWADDVFAVLASLVVGVCAAATFALARGHLPSPVVRGLLASMVVLLPTAGLEAAGNTANSHWFLMATAFWALTSRPTSRSGAALAAGVVVLAMGSDPLTAILAPLVLARVVLLRGLRDHVVTAAFVLSSAVQALVVLGTDRGPGDPTPATGEVLAAYLTRVPYTLMTGLGRAASLFEQHGWLVVVAALVPFGVAGALALLVDARTRWVALTAAPASVVFFVVPAAVSWSDRFDPFAFGVDPNPSSRYSVVPMLLLLAVAAAGLQAALDRFPRPLAGALLALVLVLGAVTVLPSFRPEAATRVGPLWDAGVLAAAQECRADPSLVSARVQIAPDRPNWVVDLPCTSLR
ncbi:hypothetical protein [uncultured Pseudokineococcus sp.]|uniref:hypothetical protein n=1 Tax=uncultured Pseudokineococcus sp. TaxID=1642928 RepID=UPI00260F6AA3|nr:hypothetical protein [uncultured Pseudokineococcus sp.]